jgi:hypothetical protein
MILREFRLPMVARFARVVELPPGWCRCEDFELLEISSSLLKARLANPAVSVGLSPKESDLAFLLVGQMAVTVRDSTLHQMPGSVRLRRGQHSVISSC